MSAAEIALNELGAWSHPGKTTQERRIGFTESKGSGTDSARLSIFSVLDP